MDPTTIEWAGLTLGRGAYRLMRLDGWEDLPSLDSGDVARPSRHGAWAGTAYAQARTVTAEVLIRTTPDAIGDRVRDLRRACAVADAAALSPLTVTLLGERLTADARVSQRIASPDRRGPLGHVRAVVQWSCPDPTRYEPDPVHVVVPPGQTRQAPQHGDTRTRPVVTFYGPVENPAVTTMTPAGGPPLTLGFTTTLFAGEFLVVDCQAGTAEYFEGSSATAALTAESVPIEVFTIAAGAPLLEAAAASSSGDARVHVTYRHAYL